MLSIFSAIVLLVLALDLYYFKVQRSHAINKVTNKQALAWSSIWIALALAFGGFLYWQKGSGPSSEFLTAYVIEEALSVDNLFVFILIFGFFKVPVQFQHKVLLWGSLGAVVFRAIFIFSGVWLINLTYLPTIHLFGKAVELNFILTLFGVFLIYAGFKSATAEEEEERDFSNSVGVKMVSAVFPVSGKFHEGNFFIHENGKRIATLLLVVVGVIEVTDVLFAVDSIPAIFSVSKDPVILYTSNIFAILGLRSMYFLLANTYQMFAYLKYGLAVILSFVGSKMVTEAFIHIPSGISLSIVGGVLVLSIVASLVWKPSDK